MCYNKYKFLRRTATSRPLDFECLTQALGTAGGLPMSFERVGVPLKKNTSGFMLIFKGRATKTIL